MPDVFISYKKEDAPRVEPIARALANAGYDIWWDHRIPAGRTYRDVIGAALQEAKCVIVVWSKLSANAQWVLDEADEGKRRNVLLPLLIDDVEAPYGFRQIEAARLVGWSGDPSDGEWQNALAAVEHFVGRPAGGPPRPLSAPSARAAAADPSPAPVAPARRGAPLAPLLIAAVVALAAGGGFLAWRSGMFGAAPAPPAEVSAALDASAVAPGAPPPEAAPQEAAAPQRVEPPASRQPERAEGALGSTEGVRLLTLNMGPRLVRETSSNVWIEVDAETGRPGPRWSETRRSDTLIELRDAGRDAGMRIALDEGWVYLYFPDWGEFRRQWSIISVNRERAPAPAPETFACYWLSNDASPTWRPMPQHATREQCFAQDSCDGGQGRSNGGCYKWAAGPNAPRQPW
ncbi:MAG: toll/interleukin-1 receptor domain-containing protein [Hyphomonadaceae bacterium]